MGELFAPKVREGLLRPAAPGMGRRRGAARAALFLASKDALKDPKVAALVVCVLSVSFVNLVFFTSFQYGVETYVRDRLVATVTSHLDIGPLEDHRYVEDVDTVVSKLRLIPGIVGIASLVEDPGVQIQFKSNVAGTRAVGAVPSEYTSVSEVPSKIIDGEFLSDEDTDQVVLGDGIATTGAGVHGTPFAKGLEVEVGERVQITFGNGVVQSYRVKGIVKTGGFSPDFSAYLTRKELEAVHPEVRNKATEVLVRLSDIRLAQDYKYVILAEGIRGEVRTWEDMAGFIEQIRGTIGMVAAVTSGVGVIAVAITIAIIIYINSAQKRRLTGVLKAIGASNGVVLGIYLYEAVLFSILGIAGGAVISLVMAQVFQRFPIPAPMGGGIVPDLRQDLLVSGAASMVVSGLLAAAYPSWRAARQPIVKSIWG